MRIRRILLLSGVLLVTARGMTAEPSGASPAFTADGRLEFPVDYRDWIFLSSGLDMSYSKKAGPPGHSMFDNVFVNPEAYREFKRTGLWPDPTVLVIDMRAAVTRASINRHGKFQSGNSTDIEVHVKDSRHLTGAGGWGFFSFEGTVPATRIALTETCYSCHQEHAAVDTTFVQFYPTLLPIATEKGTLAATYNP